MQRLTAFLVKRARASSLALLLASPAFAQAPPPIPVIADADRIASFNIVSSTSQVSVGFPVFGDCTDLQVTIAGTVQPLASGLWNCASLSGFALNTLPLPITDMVVNFTPALTTGTLVIQGAWHPRNTTVPNASGINRREYEQTFSTLVAGQRELFHNINALYAIGNVPVITNQGANSFYAGPTSGAAALPSFRAMVQPDLPAGLGVNESANTFFAGPSSGGAALPAFRAFSLNDLGTQSANTVLAGPTTGGAVAPTFRSLVGADIPLTSAHYTRQIFTSSGTYTPHANLIKALITCVGAGGGGGGAANSASEASGGGGQAGGFSRVLLTSAQIGASQTVTIGAAGTAGANTGATAGTGGATSLGSLCVANGGVGGNGSAGNTASNGGSGEAAGTGDETYIGEEGFPGGGGTITTFISGSGSGGNGPWGGGARGVAAQGNGRAGNSCGAGGSGGLVISSGGAVTGGAGFAGCVIVDEFNVQ